MVMDITATSVGAEEVIVIEGVAVETVIAEAAVEAEVVTEGAAVAVATAEVADQRDNEGLREKRNKNKENILRCYNRKEQSTGKRKRDVSVKWPREEIRSPSVLML